MYDRDIVKLKPCPVCAMPEGACMSSTQWGHDVSCCGDECGKQMGAALRSLYGSPRYKQAEVRVSEGMRALAEMREAVIASFQPQR